MTRRLTAEEKAVRASARRRAISRRNTALAERASAEEAAAPFNPRSSRESVRRSIYKRSTITIEQYSVAESLGLVGSGITNEWIEGIPIAYDGPHQVRWDPSSWHGFTQLSASRQINNINDTATDWWEVDHDYRWNEDDGATAADEESLGSWYAHDWDWAYDSYDELCDRFGGEDLTDEEYRELWSQLGGVQ